MSLPMDIDLATTTNHPGRLALRVQETADALGLSRAKTYELIADGTIPSVRIGASIRVPVDALRQMIDKQMASRQQAPA